MRKNTTNPPMKECITESLLLLLREKTLDDISIMQIVEKAGVNRSSYYRHFQTKQDIIRNFYKSLLDECLYAPAGSASLEQYFYRVFNHFLRHKQELVLLDSLSLSYLLLDELNSRLIYENTDSVQLLYFNYHIGGVFNSFCYWLRGGMTIPPKVLAQQCVKILPSDFSPQLRMR